MKKMNGVVAAMECNPYAAAYEDPRTRFRHQSLMRDFQELHKETEAMRKRLQMIRQRKSTVMAEVRFLRRRYWYLTETQSSKLQTERECMKPKKLESRSKSNSKGNKQGRKEEGIRPPVPRFDLDKERKLCKGKEAISGVVLELNQKQRIKSANENLKKPMPLPELNHVERIYNGSETAVKRRVPVFDLNQISREEEELWSNDERMMGVDLKSKVSCRRGSDELQQNMDMKLSGCRNSGNGNNRAGKRKISWQDPVALRV